MQDSNEKNGLCAGSRGKTTTAWFLRGILEEYGLLTGMAGSIEHSIANDRLTEQGELWVPGEEDPSLDMYASSAACQVWLVDTLPPCRALHQQSAARAGQPVGARRRGPQPRCVRWQCWSSSCCLCMANLTGSARYRGALSRHKSRILVALVRLYCL